MIKQALVSMTSRGFVSALSQMVFEIKVMIRHRRGAAQLKKMAASGPLKLNVGCGDKIKDGWANVDLCASRAIPLDLREKFPLPDHSCDIIYSEHFLEHLDYPEPAKAFYAEAFRILKPGGVLSAGVPDTEWPLLAYAGARDDEYFRLAKSMWHPAWCQTRLEHINYHFRQGSEHRFAYDFETMQSALKAAGFTDIKRRAFDPQLDSPEREKGTLYVEARKPS